MENNKSENTSQISEGESTHNKISSMNNIRLLNNFDENELNYLISSSIQNNFIETNLTNLYDIQYEILNGRENQPEDYNIYNPNENNESYSNNTISESMNIINPSNIEMNMNKNENLEISLHQTSSQRLITNKFDELFDIILYEIGHEK